MEPILKPGMQGDAVIQLQQLLQSKGFYDGPIDGKFGGTVTEAVINFQGAYDLLSDGVVTDETWFCLRDETPEDNSGFFSARGFDELLDDGFEISGFDEPDEFSPSDILSSEDDEIDESGLNEDLMATISPAILSQTAVHQMWSDDPSASLSAPDHFLHTGSDAIDEFSDDFADRLGDELSNDLGDDLAAANNAANAAANTAVDLVVAAQCFDLSNPQHANALGELEDQLDGAVLREFTRQWYAATETHITSLLEAFTSYDHEGPASQETALEWVQDQLSPRAVQRFAMAWGQPMMPRTGAEPVNAEDLVDTGTDLIDGLTADALTADDLSPDDHDDLEDGISVADVSTSTTDDLEFDQFDQSASPAPETLVSAPASAAAVGQTTIPDSITDNSLVMPSSLPTTTPPTMISSLSNASSSLGLLSSLINDDDDAPDFSDLPPSQLLAQSSRFVPPKQVSLVDAATSYSGLPHQSFALQTLDKQINDQLRTDFCARWMVGSQDLGLRPDETPDIISLEEAFHGYQPSQTPCQPVALKWLEGQLAELDLENFTKIWFSQNIGLGGRISLYEAANRYDPTRYPGQIGALDYINDQLGCQPGLLQQFAARWQSATSGMILATAPMGITLKETFYNFNSDRHPSQILAFAWLERQLSPGLLSEFSQRWYQAIRTNSESVK